MKFNPLIPELSVSNIEASKRFYIQNLGFKMEYERIEDKFVFLSREGNQIMLEEVNGHWSTGELQKPFGRGINFQMAISGVQNLAESLKERGIRLFKDVRTITYRTSSGPREQTEFLVQDPDGYLLRFCE